MQLGLIIETKFLGPTDYKGSRVSAVCKRDSDKAYRATIDWSHALDSSGNHQAAAEAVMAKMAADLDYEGCEPYRIVARGYGGSNDAAFYWLINRGEA